MFKLVLIVFTFCTTLSHYNANAQSSKEELWKIIQSDTFPFLYQYDAEQKVAQKMLEELSRHATPHSEDYDLTLKTVLIYQALAGNISTADSLVQIKAKINSPITNELKATKLFIEWLPCAQFADEEKCSNKTKALQNFLKNNFISASLNEAMKWHWISKMVNDSVLIDHKSNDFIYSPQLDSKDNAPAYSGSILATHRTTNSTNILVSNGYREPIQLLELNKKGKWVNVTKNAMLDSIPGGHRMYSVDINNDGYQDILILRNITPGRLQYLYPSLLINQGDGTYTDISQEFNVPQRSTCACFLDVNNDGKLDIFLGGESYGSLLFVQGENNKFTESANALGIATRPHRITDCAAYDINHDGHKDLLLGTYNHLDFVFEFKELNQQYPFFLNKSSEYNFQQLYSTGKFLIGDYDGNQSIDIITNTDHSSNEKDVVFNILSGTNGPEEYPQMRDLDNFSNLNIQEQYPLLTYMTTAVNIDKGDARPYILFGGGKQWDELYPLTLYQFLDNHYYYQLMSLKNQPNYISSMAITSFPKTQQPVLWLKGGFVNSALKNEISTYLQAENDGKFITIHLTGKNRKDALGARITVTTNLNGKEIKRTRIIQATDSQGNGAGQNIWYISKGTQISNIEIVWPDNKKQVIAKVDNKKLNFHIIQE